MSNADIDKKVIEQIKNATKVDPKLVNETKKMLDNKKGENVMLEKKKIWVSAVAICVVVVCVCILMEYDKNGIMKNNSESGIVNQNISEKNIDIIGKSGQELLDMVNIENSEDIKKIVIKKNELSDISWIEKIDDINITDKNSIELFYSQLAKLKIVNNKENLSDVNEINAAKEREIVLYLQNDECQTLHYSPNSKVLMECFKIKGEVIERKTFEQIPDDFNQWLIKICNIDMDKDYTKEYEDYKKMQSYGIMLQEYEDKDWYGGYDIIFDGGSLKLKVLLYNDKKENKEKIVKELNNSDNIIFEKTNINFIQLKQIKELISDKIVTNQDNYSYVIGCGLTSKEICIDVEYDITEKHEQMFLKDFSEYRDFIKINKTIINEE